MGKYSTAKEHNAKLIKSAMAELRIRYYTIEHELTSRLGLAKTLFAKKLIQSRETRVEMLNLLKKVVEEIENGLTEDDSAFEQFLLCIKETDRVVNNNIL